MKINKTFSLEQDTFDTLKSICERHGDLSWHLENALTAYLQKLKPKAEPRAESKQIAPHDDSVEKVIEYLNLRTGSRYQSKGKNADRVKVILKSFSVGDCKTVIDKKCREWIDTDMAKYLRPETLFGSKFEGYLYQISIEPEKTPANSTAEEDLNDRSWAQ